MAMYAVAIAPLIHCLEEIKLISKSDDATAGGTLPHLRSWWDRIAGIIGPES